MNVSAVTAPAPLKPPESVEPSPPEAKTAAVDARTAQPTVRAALPPGQGTRIDQLG